jgi:hypothetical protein
MKLEFSRQILEKKLLYQVSLKSVRWEPSGSIRSDGHVIIFRNFAKPPVRKFLYHTVEYPFFSIVLPTQ